jgi:uncharacterized membrane protein
MKLLLLVLAIVVFLVTAILAIAGSSWDTLAHLLALVSIGLAFFAASFLPIPGP